MDYVKQFNVTTPLEWQTLFTSTASRCVGAAAKADDKLCDDGFLDLLFETGTQRLPDLVNERWATFLMSVHQSLAIDSTMSIEDMSVGMLVNGTELERIASVRVRIAIELLSELGCGMH